MTTPVPRYSRTAAQRYSRWAVLISANSTHKNDRRYTPKETLLRCFLCILYTSLPLGLVKNLSFRYSCFNFFHYRAVASNGAIWDEQSQKLRLSLYPHTKVLVWGLALILRIVYNLNQRYPYLGTNMVQTINLLVVSIIEPWKRTTF